MSEFLRRARRSATSDIGWDRIVPTGRFITRRASLLNLPMVVVTDHAEDLILAQQVGRKLGIDVLLPKSAVDAQQFLLGHPEAIVFWDGDSEDARKALVRLRTQKLPVQRTVLVTEGLLHEYQG